MIGMHLRSIPSDIHRAHKPKPVPQDAVWVGGEDGGCFVSLRSVFADTCYFVIYNEYSGDVWDEGLYLCDDCEVAYASMQDWRNLVRFYDGQKLYMTNPNNARHKITWRKIREK